MNPILTIVIPTINRSALLKRALISALAQTRDDIEIIVSNNGSTDDTRAVLEGFSDPRLRIFHRETTIDACSHGNFLVEQSRGELFVGLSDDDYLEPEFAAEAIRFFAEHPGAAFAYTGCEIHYADVSVPAKLGPRLESGSEFLFAFMAGKRDVCWCACITRTADLRAIGNIPPRTICGDMFYWTRLAKQGPVGCISETLSHYIAYRHQGDNSSTGSSVMDWAKEVNALTISMMQACIDSSPGEADRLSVQRTGAAFLARSTADQFVWNALRGATSGALLGAVIPARKYLAGGGPGIWIRIAAAILAPRGLLLARVLGAARKKAEEIRRQATTESQSA